MAACCSNCAKAHTSSTEPPQWYNKRQKLYSSKEKMPKTYLLYWKGRSWTSSVYNIYIYIHTWETIERRFSVRTALDIFPSITATPLLASRRTSSASIWGSMLTYGYCCFQHDVEKILVFFEYIQIWWSMAVFVARFGYPIMASNLLHFVLKFLFGRLSKDVRTRGYQRIWTTHHNQRPTYAIKQKKTSVTGKTHNGQKNCPYCFPGIYTYIYFMLIVYVYIYI